jgi:hypothetical protein
MTAIHLENLDRRLARVEQILPTLATKEELRLTIAEAVAPLATKEELRAAIAPLATKEELDDLRRELREEGEKSRRHMDVLIEGQRGDIQLLAEHLSIVVSKIADR